MEALPEFAVLELPPSERDSNRVQAVAAALGGNSVIELPFLRSLDNDELIEACRSSLRIDRLRPGEAICLQGEEADSAYVVLSGTVSCHIRKDLQQMEAAQAYSALVQEFADADEAKAAAADRAADRRSRRQSVIGAACAGAPSAAPSPASPRAGSATASPAMQMQNRQVQNRRQSALGASGSAASTRRAYLMVPGAGDAVESGSFKKRNSVGAEGSSPGSAPASSGGSFRGWKRASQVMLTASQTAAAIRTRASTSVGPSVAILKIGDSFGEASLLSTASRRAASAVCNTACAILICPRAALSSSAGADRESKMLDFLKGVPALLGCNNASLMQLLRTCKRRDYTLGDRLTSQGSKGSSLMLLFSGEAALSVASGEGGHHHHQLHHTAAGAGSGAGGAGSGAGAGAGAAGPSSPPRAASPSAFDEDGLRHEGAQTPRDVPLRSVGPGQVIPCTPAAAGLNDGCVYPMTSRVASSHCQVLLIDCRFICLVLSKQDTNGRGLDALSAALHTDAQRLADVRETQQRRWREELSSRHFRQQAEAQRPHVDASPVDTSKVDMAHHAHGFEPQRHVGLEKASPHKTRKLPVDTLVSASSKYLDPENPTGIVHNFSARPRGSELQPTTAAEERVAATGNVANAGGASSSAAAAAAATAAAAKRNESNGGGVTRPPSAAPAPTNAPTSRRASVRPADEVGAAALAATSATNQRPQSAQALPPKASPLVRAAETSSGAERSARPRTAEKEKSLEELGLVLTPRQLRPQSANANARSTVVDRQNDFLSKVSTLKRYSAPLRGKTGSSSPRTAAADRSPRQRPQTADPRVRTVRSPSMSVRISGGDNTPSAGQGGGGGDAADDANGLAAQLHAPTAAAAHASGSTWVPSHEEWQHVARLNSARGKKPPANLPLPSEVARGNVTAEALSQWHVRPPPSELTPLAVSLINDNAFVGRILAKRSQQQLMQQGLHGAAAAAEAVAAAAQTGFLMPTFSPSARAPWLSNAVLGSFSAEEQQHLASPRAKPGGFVAMRPRPGGYKNVSPRRRPHSARANAFPFSGRPPPSPPPPSPDGERGAAGIIARAARPSSARLKATKEPGGAASQAAQPPRLWTRPIAVDGPGVANALAFQQASLA